jgi:hypothetical protein
MPIVTRQQLGREKWDAAVAESPQAWLWHRYDVCDATIQDWPGRTDAAFAVVGGDGEVEAIVPAFIWERRTPIRLAFRHLNSMGGPALSTRLGRGRRREALETVARELVRRAEAVGAVRTTISLAPMAPEFRGPDGPRCNPLLYLGCKDVSGQTWIADLRDGVDAIWKRMEGRARTSIRQAQSAGVSIRKSMSVDEWSHFFSLHKETYRRLAVPAYPAALFRLIFEKLIPANLCYVQFAERNGEIIAAQNIGLYKHGGYYWHGFASQAGLEFNATTLLLWSSIKNLVEETGLQWMDCGDAVLSSDNAKLYQLSNFKKSFGGALYPAFRGQFDGTNKLYNRLLHVRGLLSGR